MSFEQAETMNGFLDAINDYAWFIAAFSAACFVALVVGFLRSR